MNTRDEVDLKRYALVISALVCRGFTALTCRNLETWVFSIPVKYYWLQQGKSRGICSERVWGSGSEIPQILKHKQHIGSQWPGLRVRPLYAWGNRSRCPLGKPNRHGAGLDAVVKCIYPCWESNPVKPLYQFLNQPPRIISVHGCKQYLCVFFCYVNWSTDVAPSAKVVSHRGAPVDIRKDVGQVQLTGEPTGSGIFSPLAT
jgi:hypothetical protein